MVRRARVSSILSVVWLALVVGGAGCGDSPTAPTAELGTETFTGTLGPLGLSSHTFNVNYAQAYSDASVTVTRLVAVAAGTFCIAIFDNTAAPTVTEALTYTLTIKHY